MAIVVDSYRTYTAGIRFTLDLGDKKVILTFDEAAKLMEDLSNEIRSQEDMGEVERDEE